MSWTQPLCDTCWKTENPDRQPVRMRNPDLRVCCMCGNPTNGIFIRRNPAECNFPEEDSEIVSESHEPGRPGSDRREGVDRMKRSRFQNIWGRNFRDWRDRRKD